MCMFTSSNHSLTQPRPSQLNCYGPRGTWEKNSTFKHHGSKQAAIWIAKRNCQRKTSIPESFKPSSLSLRFAHRKGSPVEGANPYKMFEIITNPYQSAIPVRNYATSVEARTSVTPRNSRLVFAMENCTSGGRRYINGYHRAQSLETDQQNSPC